MGFANRIPATRGSVWLDLALRLVIVTLAAAWLLLPPGRIAEPSPQAQARATTSR